MSDNLDSGNVSGSEGGQPVASPNAGVSGGSEQATQLQEIAGQLKSLRAEVDATKRLAQGDKDRAVKRVEGDLRKLIDEWEEAKGKGTTPDDFAFRKEMTEFMAEVRGQKPTQSPPAGSGASVELQNIEAQLGLPPNDPRVTDLKLKYANDPIQFAVQGAKLMQSLSAPSPTPAEQPLPQGGSRPAPNAQAEYEKRRGEIVASTRAGEERLLALTNLKAEFAGKGLPVY